MKTKLLLTAVLLGLLTGCVVEEHGRYPYGFYPLGHHNLHHHHGYHSRHHV